MCNPLENVLLAKGNPLLTRAGKEFGCLDGKLALSGGRPRPLGRGGVNFDFTCEGV